MKKYISFLIKHHPIKRSKRMYIQADGTTTGKYFTYDNIEDATNARNRNTEITGRTGYVCLQTFRSDGMCIAEQIINSTTIHDIPCDTL